MTETESEKSVQAAKKTVVTAKAAVVAAEAVVVAESATKTKAAAGVEHEGSRKVRLRPLTKVEKSILQTDDDENANDEDA